MGRSVVGRMHHSFLSRCEVIAACRGLRSPCLPPLFLFDARRDFGSPGAFLDVGRACACVATRALRFLI
jgi:hypothetical protein